MDSGSCISILMHIHVTVMIKENGVINLRMGSTGGGGGKELGEAGGKQGENGTIFSN